LEIHLFPLGNKLGKVPNGWYIEQVYISPSSSRLAISAAR